MQRPLLLHNMVVVCSYELKALTVIITTKYSNIICCLHTQDCMVEIYRLQLLEE